jgi:hypothetical protein
MSKREIAAAILVCLIRCGFSYSRTKPYSKSEYRLAYVSTVAHRLETLKCQSNLNSKTYYVLSSNHGQIIFGRVGHVGIKRDGASNNFKLGFKLRMNEYTTPNGNEKYQEPENSLFRWKWNILYLIKRLLRFVIKPVQFLFRRPQNGTKSIKKFKPDQVNGSCETQLPVADTSSSNWGVFDANVERANTTFDTVKGHDKLGDNILQPNVTGFDVRNRSEFAAGGVDLSGRWSLIVDETFKQEYDKYLRLLGQPSLVRSVALSIAGMTKEETKQNDEGKTLYIRGINARGVWERTLYASNADDSVRITPIVTADSETVDAEAWWAGESHVSWLRGIQKYGGGDFESRRYLEEKGEVLVCETVFHPSDASRKKANIIWKFRKQQK